MNGITPVGNCLETKHYTRDIVWERGARNAQSQSIGLVARVGAREVLLPIRQSIAVGIGGRIGHEWVGVVGGFPPIRKPIAVGIEAGGELAGSGTGSLPINRVVAVISGVEALDGQPAAVRSRRPGGSVAVADFIHGDLRKSVGVGRVRAVELEPPAV